MTAHGSVGLAWSHSKCVPELPEPEKWRYSSILERRTPALGRVRAPAKADKGGKATQESAALPRKL